MRVCVTILLRVSVLVCVRAHGSPVRTVPSVSIRRVCGVWPRVCGGHNTHIRDLYTDRAFRFTVYPFFSRLTLSSRVSVLIL